MLLDIITYPNKSLRQISQKVECFDLALHTTLDNMYETMIAKNGVGLAAIQVGIPKRMLIINLPREDKILHKEDLLEIINPEILSAEGEILFQEGCLSVPNFYEMIQRFSFVRLKYCDRFGNENILEAEDYLAVAIQHEIDHLNGVLFVDKLSILKRKKFEKEYKRLQKEGFKSVHLPESAESNGDLGESSANVGESKANLSELHKDSRKDSRESKRESTNRPANRTTNRAKSKRDSRKRKAKA